MEYIDELPNSNVTQNLVSVGILRWKYPYCSFNVPSTKFNFWILRELDWIIKEMFQQGSERNGSSKTCWTRESSNGNTNVIDVTFLDWWFSFKVWGNSFNLLMGKLGEFPKQKWVMHLGRENLEILILR